MAVLDEPSMPESMSWEITHVSTPTTCQTRPKCKGFWGNEALPDHALRSPGIRRQRSPEVQPLEVGFLPGMPSTDDLMPLRQSSTTAPRCKYYESLLHTLTFFGWLPKLSSGALRHLPFISTVALDIFVVLTTLHGSFAGPEKTLGFSQLRYVHSVIRHVLILAAHLGMYCVGGSDLSDYLWTPRFSFPHAHFAVLVVFAAMAFCLDLTLLYSRYAGEDSRPTDFAHGLSVVTIRRLIVMLERLPSAFSLLIMTALPQKLCRDLKRTLEAIEAKDIATAQHLYCAFWQQLRLGRTWYNAIATAHFLSAVCRIPVGVYIVTHWYVVQTNTLEVFCLLAYTAIDTFQMIVWIHPAIHIREKHGRVMRAAVEAASCQTKSSTAFATMVASLHPLVGLKMLGFIVSGRLVAQVTTIASLVLTGLRHMLEGKESSGNMPPENNFTNMRS